MEKTCSKGHTFMKTSACLVCPICEQERTPIADFLTLFPAPARRALENHGITSIEKLATITESEILTFHGFGPKSIKILSTLIL